MKNLGKEAEARVVRAIEDVVRLVDGGASPTDAVVKTAEAHNLRPGYVNVLVHAYNTGSTTRHRDAGNSTLEKAAEFELADPAAVLEQIYPTKVASAAEIDRATSISPEYGVTPIGMLRRHEMRKTALQAVDIRAGIPAYKPLPRDPEGALRKAAGDADRAHNTIEEARRKSAAAMDIAVYTLAELRDYFKTAGHMPFQQFRRQAAVLHGSLAERVCDQLQSVYPPLTKQADDVNARIDMYAEPFQLLQKLAARVDEYNRLHSAYLALELKSAASEVAHAPFARRGNSVLEDPCSTDKQANMAWNPFTQTVLGSFTKDTLNGVASKMGPSPDESMQDAALASLNDPAHEAELRNIRTQATLHELMMEDPVLRGYQPREVLGAFDDISQLSPRAADQRPILQTLLRQRLAQGQLSGFEIDQTLGMENKLKQREGTPGATSNSVL